MLNFQNVKSFIHMLNYIFLPPKSGHFMKILEAFSSFFKVATQSKTFYFVYEKEFALLKVFFEVVAKNRPGKFT